MHLCIACMSCELPEGFNSFSSICSRTSASLYARSWTVVVTSKVRQPAGLKRWYLSVIDQIARETGRVRVQSIEGLGWAEMDFPADVARNRALTERWVAQAS